FQVRSRTEILEQIRQLKIFHGRNLENYNALFLGNHDALAAGDELIYLAGSEASKIFGFEGTRTNTPMLFFFGSVDSLLKSKSELFEKISSLPFYTYINIGFESIDPPTLKFIGKPISASMIQEAFTKMLEINATYPNIEMTDNFLMGKTLRPEHYQSLAELLGDVSVPSKGKGAIYLSPIKDSPKKRELLPQFFEIKNQSQLPVFFYLIQRL
ncbi:MAG: radical SAM protein, partial [Deltaproteobacteria bacterium]|nr:radical SAM protein [Deltaproteobacteria bacterium]